MTASKLGLVRLSSNTVAALGIVPKRPQLASNKSQQVMAGSKVVRNYEEEREFLKNSVFGKFLGLCDSGSN